MTKRQRRRKKRRCLLEQLQPRVVLNAAPVAVADPWYKTPQNTSLVIGTSDTTLLENDWDAEGSSLTASVVDNPANGTLSSFNSDGTFTYVPNFSFSGLDSFSYKVSDGTADSNVVNVSIAVDGDFGPRTNGEELPRASLMLTGGVELAEPLTPGIALLYQSNTIPEPIVVVETTVQPNSAMPSGIDAQLTFNGTAGTTYSYGTSGLTSGDSMRFALQADATALSTGRYDYSVELTANVLLGSTSQTFSGSQDVVNRSDSSHPFGRGWQLAGLDELVVDSSGALWVQSDGTALWFEDDGSGGFEDAEGDHAFSSLVENLDGTFTLTFKTGGELNFDSSGNLTSREDRNGNTVTYAYTGGLLTSITDPFSRSTTLTYTGGQLTSVTDFASRTATLAYDGSGRLTSITQPDPDGGGSLAAPETDFSYDATTHRLTQRTDALNDSTSYSYGSHGRLTTITHPDSETVGLTATQTIGLPSGTSGNTISPADPLGTLTDERGNSRTFRTDRFGFITEWNNALGHQTLRERNAAGQVARITGADPDGAGPLASSITTSGYDPDGNLVYQEYADGTTRTWTYAGSFHKVATSTDELGRTISFGYDSSGNTVSATDAAGNQSTFTYDSSGFLTGKTTPDPDGTGPLSAATTSYAYDSNGRLSTITHPDSSTFSFTYDSADNVTETTDELGNSTTYVFDSLGRVTSATDAEGATASYAYDELGQLTSETDVLGGVTDYTYNSRGFLTDIVYPDPDGAGPLNRSEAGFIYDEAGNATSYQISGGGAQQRYTTVTFTYDAAGRLTGESYPEISRSKTYEYDNLGRLTGDLQTLHLQTRYEYDSRGRVTKITQGDEFDSSPPTTTYGYDAAGQLTSITDPRGYSTSYEYNSRGLLYKETLPDPDGSGAMFARQTVYHYDNAGRMTDIYGTYTRHTELEYDSRNNLVKAILPDPNDQGEVYRPVLEFTYDMAGNLLSENDPLGNTTTYTYDDVGRVATVTGADPDDAGPLSAPVITYAYNDAGNITSVTDPNAGVTSYVYDTLGRATSITGADPDGAGALASPVMEYTYDDLGFLIEVTDPANRDTSYTYDTMGRRTGVTDHLGNTTTYAYNQYNYLTSVTSEDPDDSGPLTASVTSFQYDVFGRRTRITDAESGNTYFTYDDAGNLLTLKDAENNTTSFAYDGLGRLTMETNQLGKTRSYEYAAEGNLSRRVDRNGRVMQFTHDNLERLTKESWYTNASPTPELTITTDTEGGSQSEVQRVGYSGMAYGGIFTLTIDSETTSSLSYDASAAQVQSALESLTAVGSGNVTVSKTSDFSSVEWTLTFGGSLAGTNVSQATIDTSGISGFSLTETEATDTDGGNFDEQQTIDLDNANGGTFRLAFSGETTAALDYDATAAEVDFALEELNAIDQVTVTGSAGGPWTVTFAGTMAGTDVSSIMGDAAASTSGTLDRTISYTFDKASQLTEVSDPDSSYAYTYDNLGRVLTVDNDGTTGVPRVVLTSAYDSNGNRTSLSATIDSTDDFVNTYTYDALNRLTTVEQEGVTGGNTVAEKRVDFSYLVDGRYDTIARYNSLAGGSSAEIATSSYTYDTLGRLTGLDYQQGGTSLFTAYGWTYDDLNRITQFTSADGTTDYDYDKTSQLTDADHSYQTDESYTYDGTGNRTNTGYTTGTDNRLTNDGTYSYEYDDEGNRTKRTHDTTGEETVYEWDFRNRLTSVTEKDSLGSITKVVEYTYDAFDRRIGKAVDATSPFDMADAAIERYIIDDITGIASDKGSNVVLDFVDPDGAGAAVVDLENRHLYGDAVDQVLAHEDVTVSASSEYRVIWPLVDNLGTVRDLARNDGDLDEHYTYDAFGKIVSGDISKTRFLFTGREFDIDTSLQYNRARWYDSTTGVWINQDPLGFKGGDANLNRYVSNQAVSATDPSGMSLVRPSDLGSGHHIIPVEIWGDYWRCIQGHLPRQG